MFRDMRRQDRELSKEATLEMIKNGKFGVLSLFGENGYPYGVPIHYVIDKDSIFFHCSKAGGHKIEALKKKTNISFTVIETEDGVKSRSAIVFGMALEVPKKRQFVLEKLVEKFVPEIAWEEAKSDIPYAVDNILAFEIKCDYMSGKWIDKPEGR